MNELRMGISVVPEKVLLYTFLGYMCSEIRNISRKGTH